MKINLIHCVLSMVIGAAVVIAWYEHNWDKRKAWAIFEFKCDTLYGFKDAIFHVVMEDEDLKKAVLKEDKKIQMYLVQDFRDEWDMLGFGKTNTCWRSSKKVLNREGD